MATRAEPVEFVAEKDGIFPEPLEAKPIDVLSFVQVVPVKTLVKGILSPVQTFKSGNELELLGIVKVKTKGYIPQPSVVNAVFPLITVKVIGTPVGRPE